MKVDVVRIGSEGEPVVVVDDLVADPAALVEQAAALALTPMGAFYPGLRASVPASYCAEIAPLVGTAMRRIFGYHARMRFERALFSLVTTPSAELSLAQRIPHVDGVEEGRVAIVHFLGAVDHGGTSFWRHRSTGFETVDQTRQRRYLDTLRADFDRLGEPPPAYIGADTAVFERTALFDARPNRALIYRSKLLHCAAVPDRPLSADPRLGRLTVASFLTAR